MAMYCDDPMPFGKLTRKHLYALGSDVFSDFNAMAYALSKPEPDQPTLAPAMRAGGLFLYDEGAAEAWIAAMRVWVADAPARREARRKAAFDQATRATAEEMARIRIQQEGLQAAQEAGEKFRAEKAEWEASRGPLIIQAGRG